MKGRTKKHALVLLAISMIASMLFLNANAKEATTDDSNVLQSFTAAEASGYLAGENSYPTKEGYVFGGWYTTDTIPEDVEEAKQYVVENDIPEDVSTVYALFVPEKVLSVKAQVSVHLTDDEVTNKDNKGVIRFVTSVDSLLYRRVGFDVTYESAGKTKNVTLSSDKVYEKLYEADTENVWEVTPQSEFCAASKYFKACTISNVALKYYETEFTVKPYWVTMSGEKVYGETATKSVDKGCARETVYVSSVDSNANDKPQYGSAAYPYASLDYAIAHTKDNGTVRVKDSLVAASDATWTAHGKTITITGDGDDATTETLDLTNLRNASDAAHLYINDNVTFTDIHMQFPTYVFANGYHVKVADDVEFLDHSSKVYIYGGGYTTHVSSTNLELYAGSYAAIYGGGHQANVNKNTKVVVGGNINPNATGTDHTARNYMLYGGCRRGNVNGNTNVIVQAGAKFDCVYGAGGSLEEGSIAQVKGTSNVEFAGKTYSLYGGGRYGTNADTQVKVVGGEVYQLFGGCEHRAMTGNTNVEVLGGNVLRRIYGGCYNNYDSNGWETENHVTGTTSVTIGTNVSLNKESDKVLCAISRSDAGFEDEIGILIFKNDLYSSLSGKVQNLWSSHAYNYLVVASANGDVAMAEGGISLTPDAGKNVLVRLDSATGEMAYVADKASTYELPELVNGTRTLYVTFPETLPTVDVTVADSANGTVTTDQEAYYAGSTVTLTVTPDEGYYCTALSVTKAGEAVAINPAFTLGENTYTFDAVDGEYVVEASFARQIFKLPSANPTNTSWDITDQCQSEETLENGGTKITGIVYATDLQEKDKTDLLEFVEDYTDMDLTYVVKDDPSCTTGSATPGTTLTLSFEGYSYQVRAVKNGDNIVLRVVAGMSKNTNMYTFTEDQATKFASAEGIEVRAVRSGVEVHFFVDGTYAYTVDLATVSDGLVAADTQMDVNFKRFGDTGTKVAIPFTMINKVNVAKVTVNSTTNGTVTSDSVLYNVGETATLTVAPKSGYYCNSLVVKKDDVAISLDKALNLTDAEYSFVVEEGTYTVEATFVKKVFTTPTSTYTSWNLVSQNESMETLANGGTKITGTVYATDLQEKDKMDNLTFVNKYVDMDFTYVAKDDPSCTVGSTTPGTQIVLDFDGYSYQVRAVKNSGNIVLRVVGGMSANTNMYTFTTEQAEKFASADGVQIRMVRCGTTVAFYVDGTFAYSADISALNSIVTADREMKVSIKRFGDTGTAVAIPFTVINKVSPAVKVEEATNGTVAADKVLYAVGESATLTVTPDSGYYCNSLTVKKDGEEVELDKALNMTDTTYSFVLEDAVYTVEATFAKKVFTTPTTATKTVWNLMNQNESMETLANGGTKITGTLYSTCVVTSDGTDALAFASKYTDMDLSLKVKDDPSTTAGNATPGTTLTFDFSSYVFQVRAVKNGSNIVLRVLNGLSSKTNVYTFTTDQANKFTSTEGVDLRAVRSGTDLYLYVDGALAYTLDLAATSVALGKTEVTATTKMSVNIRRYGDQNVAVAIPFSVCDKVTPLTVAVQNGTAVVANDVVASDVQKLHLTANETYSVKLTANGLKDTGYFKITYVNYVTGETQSVYTPAVSAGESFEFTYKNGLFNAETEAEIATVLWENRVKATKDILTVEVINGTPEGETIAAGAGIGNEPMGKPAAVSVATTWTLGSAVSNTGEITENAAYAYTDVITVAKKGTKVYFTDTVKTDSWATSDVFVVSSWKQDENESWVIDTEGTNIAGQYTTGEITCTEGYEVFVERYDGEKITYTYITSKDNENIRFCYYAGEGTTTFPTVWSIYSGETGTAVEIALAADTATWLENDKARAYYDIFAGKTISVIGDSYMAGSSIGNTANVWVNMFATKYGMTMNNHGINGSTISNYAGSKYNPMVDRWESDFANDTPDIIIVEGGRNDYNYNTPMGELGTTDKGTMKGATAYLISSLKEKYPNAIIIGISCWEVGGNRNAAGYYCSDYGRAFIEVCENLGIPYVNAMDSEAMDVYMTSSNFRGRFCIKAGDISHLNEKGMKLVLPIFEEKIYEACANQN